MAWKLLRTLGAQWRRQLVLLSLLQLLLLMLQPLLMPLLLLLMLPILLRVLPRVLLLLRLLPLHTIWARPCNRAAAPEALS